MQAAERLVRLYQQESKHANYQEIPTCLRPLLRDVHLAPSSGQESARLAFILKHLPVGGLTVVDIGANTGYFTFELLSAGAAAVTAYEGNPTHAEFIRLAAESVGLADKVTVHNEYFYPERQSYEGTIDLILLMNVLHHVGDDYGQSAGIDHARTLIAESLRWMAGTASYMVFQLGYNWKGNRELPLFTHGTKSEQIDFFKEAATGYWDIVAIGIAEMQPDGLTYSDPTPTNLARKDSYGEFLNRPLFLCHAHGATPVDGRLCQWGMS